MAHVLTSTELESQLAVGWEYNKDEKAIVKEFKKKDFLEAVEFIGLIAPLAQAQDHHPDLFLHGYNNVRVLLSTHSAGGVTENDFKLAKSIDAL